MEGIDSLRQELDCIGAVGIYDYSTQNFNHKDENLVGLELLESMTVHKCFDSLDFLYLQIGSSWYFFRRKEQLLLIIHLKEIDNVNRVILELKAGEFLNENF